MSKPDRAPIIHPDDPRNGLGFFDFGFLGIPTFFIGIVFLMPALAVLFTAVPEILSGQSSISLGGSLLLIIALIPAWGGVVMIRAALPSRRR